MPKKKKNLPELCGGQLEVMDVIWHLLDKTEEDLRLRAIPFMMRAIGDRRSVPALILAIPKRRRPPGSDMECYAKEANVVQFAQKFDLDTANRGQGFSFGRPVR
jgi:hypothetical protein